ncbi:hypothetical protein VCHA43P277_90236 [Vibrio chagasii]|nr:hypothetical protein VCHA37O173_20007 [Vibrio chagasii]CAH6876785.1 hypothetical protein VCHA29O39_250033 [Vibrio chagasii]CAH6918065.1 hypothetical protein VCHA34P116_30142 [Vibrio chagasii]CAH6927299.1 hypothetical protein VCHA32P90_30143 [Vibrio chagasii]CAH6953233.1 hypothetical protein VCHA35O137_40142 [Vibrio chagasii]
MITGISIISDHHFENPAFLRIGPNNKYGSNTIMDSISNCQTLMPAIINYPPQF